MRARHRHFNPSTVNGAVGVYDARFTSFSNNAAVDSWASRTQSNAVEQSNSSFRPTFKNNEINGQPAVDFDGTNDWLRNANNLNFSQVHVFSVSKAQNVNANGRALMTLWPGLNLNGMIHLIYRNNITNNFRAFFSQNNGASFNIKFPTSTYPTTPAITVASYSGTATELRIDGTLQSNGSDTNAAAGPQSNLNVQIVIGDYYNLSTENYSWSGPIGFVSVFNVKCSAELQKRLEHAAAYSYKISCN